MCGTHKHTADTSTHKPVQISATMTALDCQPIFGSGIPRGTVCFPQGARHNGRSKCSPPGATCSCRWGRHFECWATGVVPFCLTHMVQLHNTSNAFIPSELVGETIMNKSPSRDKVRFCEVPTRTLWDARDFSPNTPGGSVFVWLKNRVCMVAFSISDAFFCPVDFGLHTHPIYIEWLDLYTMYSIEFCNPAADCGVSDSSGPVPCHFLGPAKKRRTTTRPKYRNPTAWIYTPLIPRIYRTTMKNHQYTTILPPILNHSQLILWALPTS